MSNLIEYIPSATIGRPVANGSLYFGNPDTDPEIPANQKQVYAVHEDGTAVAITQPVSTSGGGVPEYNGSPVRLKIEAPYALKVLSSAGSQIYYFASLNASSIAVPDYVTLRTLDGTFDGEQVAVAYKTSLGDDDGGNFYWWSADLSTEVAADPTSENYVAPDSDPTGASGAWVKQLRLDEFALKTDINPLYTDLSPVYLEQFITGFRGRGMIAAEAPNITTEQAFTAGAFAGATSVSVTDPSLFDPGGTVSILHSNGLYETYFVTSTGASTVGIVPGLKYDVTIADSLIERTWYNQPHPGKFYMRELAQRIARGKNYENELPQNGRLFFSQFDTNPVEPNDTLNAVAGGVVNYFDALNLGQGVINLPVEFNIGRTAFVSISSVGDGAETNYFPINGVSGVTIRMVAMVRNRNMTMQMEIVDQDGKTVGIQDLGLEQAHKIVNIPAQLYGRATSIKLKFTATAVPVASAFILDQLEVFPATRVSTETIIDTHRPVNVVVFGDSWVAGDLGSTPEREPITQQLAIELPDANVINEGFGGDKVQDLLARFDADVATQDPDYVVVNVGTNDAYNPASGTFDPNSIDFYTEKMTQLITKIQAIGAKPIIIGVPALAEEDGAATAYLLNDRAKAYSRYLYKRLSGLTVGRQVVGTASQDDGIDTGAIIERGSNANGEYTKWADGTMECWRSATVDLTSTAAQQFTVPVAFDAGYPVAGSVSLFTLNSGNAYAAMAASTIRATTTLWEFKTQTASTASETLVFRSIGRWF